MSQNYIIFALCFFIFALKSFKTCKNTEKGDFDQRFECAAPKCWSKYETHRSNSADIGLMPRKLCSFLSRN